MDYSGLVYILSDLIDGTFIFSKRRTGQSKRDSKAAGNKDRQIVNQRNEYNQIIKQLQDSLAGRKKTNMDSVEDAETGS